VPSGFDRHYALRKCDAESTGTARNAFTFSEAPWAAVRRTLGTATWYRLTGWFLGHFGFLTLRVQFDQDLVAGAPRRDLGAGGRPHRSGRRCCPWPRASCRHRPPSRSGPPNFKLRQCQLSNQFAAAANQLDGLVAWEGSTPLVLRRPPLEFLAINSAAVSKGVR
jgi:hypothetical protein